MGVMCIGPCVLGGMRVVCSVLLLATFVFRCVSVVR